MMLLRALVWGLILYLLIKIVKNIRALFLASKEHPTVQGMRFRKNPARYSIKQEDIIDASFEEIIKPETDKQNNKL